MARISLKKLKDSRNQFERQAEELGLSDNFLFISTLKRLDVQINVLANLEKGMEEDELTVTKEYVKGRKNLYLNPAIDGYNKTAQQANATTQVLVKIIKDLGGKAEDGDDL